MIRKISCSLYDQIFLSFLKLISPLQDKISNQYLIKLFRIFYNKLAPNTWILQEINDGIKLWVNLHDRAFSRYIIQQKIYEPGTTKIFKSVLKKGMIVADVGACLGYYSLIAAKIVGHEGKVFAFEPHPTNYMWLLKNIELNNAGDIIIPVNKAISNKKGKIKLYFSRDYSNIGGHSILQFPTCGNQDYIEAETICLDEFFTEIKPHVIKLDIEGGEIFALKGMENLIKNSYELYVFIEYEHNINELNSFLEKHSMSIFYITKDGKLISFQNHNKIKKSKKLELERNILAIKGGGDVCEDLLLDT